MSVSEIVASTQMDKSVVSRQLHDLKQWGLVTLRRSEEDARVFLVEPTELAQQRVREIHERNRAEFRRAFSEWDPSDVRRLVELIGRLADVSAPAL